MLNTGQCWVEEIPPPTKNSTCCCQNSMLDSAVPTLQPVCSSLPPVTWRPRCRWGGRGRPGRCPHRRRRTPGRGRPGGGGESGKYKSACYCYCCCTNPPWTTLISHLTNRPNCRAPKTIPTKPLYDQCNALLWAKRPAPYLVDHLSRPWSNDVRPQQAVRRLVPQDLHEAVRLVVALRPGGRPVVIVVVGVKF